MATFLVVLAFSGCANRTNDAVGDDPRQTASDTVSETVSTATPTLVVETLSEEVTFRNRIVVRPPKPGTEPKISDSEAFDIVLGNNPYNLSAMAELALMTDKDMRPIDEDGNYGPLVYEDVLVWLVTVDGFCDSGGGLVATEPDPCIYHAVVDANTGKDLIDF